MLSSTISDRPMTTTPDQSRGSASGGTTSIEITERQRNIILDALYDKEPETERYLTGSEVDEQPGPLDNCCEAHLDRYRQRKEVYKALKARKKAVKRTIKLFTAPTVDEDGVPRTDGA